LKAIQAVEELADNGSPEQHAMRYFIRAMAYWQLGDKAEARQFYDQAVGWMEQKQDGTDEEDNRRFRAEAAELLGISEQPNGKEVVPEMPDPAL
jgi:predicted RNA polymerase sigma factor